MISSLKIKNFKSIVDVDIDFGDVNLFIGANGSGKSNLITTQAKRNLSSRSGIGGVRSAT